MKILLTGAFGNVGLSTLKELIDRGHQVRCFDIKTKANEKTARKYQEKCEIIWGDLRVPDQIAQAVQNQDAVIHLAFVIPTLSATGVGSEEDPDWAREINVGGTRNLIQAVQNQPKPPSIIFSSSLHIYGRTHDQPPPRKVDDPLQPIEHYAHHKVICENMLRESGLNWAIYRLGAVLPVRLILDRGMFGVPLDNRIEFVHSKDVAVALANGLENDGVWGRVWHIGGGPACQLYQREIVKQVLDAVGLDMLPEEAFTSVPFPTDWLDTSESQELLQFQDHSFQDYLEDLKALLGFRRHLIRLFRPLIRWWMLRQSPVWARFKAVAVDGEKVAVVTGASGGIGRATARQLAAKGYKVVLVSRNEDKLERVADQIQIDGGEALVLTADLEVEEECSRLHNEITTNVGQVDILVNSAGSGWYGFSDEMPWVEARRMIDLNIKAMAKLTLLFLPGMKQRGQGHIVNISSIAGGLPSQGVGLYSATKSFVDAFTTSLHRELKGTGVHVSSVRPGPVHTPFLDPIAAELKHFGIPLNRLAIRPETVAGGITRLIKRPKRVIYLPRILRIIPWIELSLGWLMDMLGPLLLQRREGATIKP